MATNAKVMHSAFGKRRRLWIALLLLTSLGGLSAAAEGGPVEQHRPDSMAAGTRIADVRIVIDAPPERQAYFADMATQIIPLQPGGRLTAHALKNAIAALKLSNRFATIHVDTVAEGEGEILVFTLTPCRFIKDIRITGQYPLFERDILNQMTLYPGDPYTEAELTAQIEAIVKRYQREGFIDPEVDVYTRGEPDEEFTVVHVDIDKGDAYRLGSLRFEGNRGLSTTTLKWRMAVWRSSLIPGVGRFSEYRLKKDMDALLKVYRRKGFADAALTYRIAAPDTANRIDVTIQVDEGTCYRIGFEGNRQFWDLTLEKDVTLFTDGNRSNIGIRRSIRNMVNRYRAAGYLDTQIEAATTMLPGDPVAIRQLRFVIREGPRSIVDGVSIEGNQAIAEATIREQVLTRPPTLFHVGSFVPETLEKDVYAVSTLYMQRGFQDRQVDSEATFNADRTHVDVALTIDEGPQTTVRSIAIQGVTTLTEDQVRQRLTHRIGEPFRQTTLDQEKEAITSLVAEQGYPHATVTSRVSFSDDRNDADIVHTVDQGPLVKLGRIFVAGNLRTKEKIIHRELEVQPGEPLSLQTLYDGQRRLRDLNIFHGVAFRTFGLKEEEETVNLFVDVEENKPFYAQVSVGYESDSGFYGRTRFGDRNLFGLNKDLWAEAKISQTGYRVESRLAEPRFFNTRTTASIGVFNEEQTEFNQPFGTRTTGGSLTFGRDWGDHVATALNFSLEKRDQFSVEDVPTDPSEEATRTIFVTTPYIRYDSRDSFVRPTKGGLTSLRVDLSKGMQNQLDDFVRYVFDARYFFTPVRNLTLAGLVRIGQVLSYSDNDDVPSDQLFYLGGISDVRGFKENLLRFDEAGNPVGGRTALVGSLEARIDLGLNLELTTFFDIGSVQDALVEAGSDRFRPSVGMGLRYITPIGPMGLLYGHKLDREEGESAGQWNLSIGYSF